MTPESWNSPLLANGYLPHWNSPFLSNGWVSTFHDNKRNRITRTVRGEDLYSSRLEVIKG
jgi:hypothetical protein